METINVNEEPFLDKYEYRTKLNMWIGLITRSILKYSQRPDAQMRNAQLKIGKLEAEKEKLIGYRDVVNGEISKEKEILKDLERESE